MTKEKYIEHLKELARVYRQMMDQHNMMAYECMLKWDTVVNLYQDLEDVDGNE